MLQFGKKKQTAETAPDGKSFLATAMAEHGELFATFAANADDYDTVEEYTEALQSQAWELTEGLAKASYKNGIARGRSAQRHGKK